MENKQETSQSKPVTKSYRRRQRRKEAAALQKQAASVVSQKVESSVQFLENLSDNNTNKNSVPVDNLKKVDEIRQNQLNSQPNFGRKSNEVSSNIVEHQGSSPVIQKKKTIESEVSNIPYSKRGSNRKKLLSGEGGGGAQGKNINIKERQPWPDISKTDDNTRSHEPCPSIKGSFTPKTLSKKVNKNSSPASSNDLKSLVSVQGDSKSSFDKCETSVTGDECIGKLKKLSDINDVPNEIKNQANSMDDNLKRKNDNRLTENLQGTLRKNLQVKEDPDKSIKPTVSNSDGKTEKLDNIPNTSNIPGNCVDEEQIQSSFIFQQTGIYSFHTSHVHLGIKTKDPLEIPQDSNKAKGVLSSENKMNKIVGKVAKQSSKRECALLDEVCTGKNDKCVPGVAGNLKKAAKVEGLEKEISEKSREQVKAEREARKAAKLLKKQKEKASPDTKEIRDTNAGLLPVASEPLVDKNDEKNSGMLNKPDSLTTPIQNSEFSENKKSKAELRAERRAKQEAQRAAKTYTTTPTPLQSKTKVAVMGNTPEAHQSTAADLKDASVKVVQRKGQGAKLLSRLGLEESRSQNWRENSLLDTQYIHPVIVQLATRFTDRIISGSNARCIAFVQAIKKAIQDYETPPQKELGRDMESRLLAPSLAYLEAQRPHAVSVSNATRFLKWQLTQLQPLQDCSSEKKIALPDEKAKHNLIEGLESYIWEKIEVAERAVCDTLRDKIKDGDVILTYGCSYLLQQIFIGAKKAGTMFKVVVVDGRPWREGREMLRCLVSFGIPCSYVLLSAASSVMRQVNKVVLGAHALLSNGYVMSRVGVSQVALLASAHNVPVLVACETHKFCERVQSDSFVYNEMGEPDGLAQLLGGEDGPLSGWKTFPSLSLLNLSYDVTPPELVTAVATELAVLPCTSVPVVLRVRPMEPVTSRH